MTIQSSFTMATSFKWVTRYFFSERRLNYLSKEEDMRKIVTEETIRQACSNRIAIIRAEEEEQLKSVERQTQQLVEQFDETIDKAGFSSNAFVPSEKLDFTKDSRSLPDGLFVGMLKHPVTGESFIPAILPFASANATGFCIDSSCENQVAELMQNLAFRILLSIPVELVKCHFIAIEVFGAWAKPCDAHGIRLPAHLSHEALGAEQLLVVAHSHLDAVDFVPE